MEKLSNPQKTIETIKKYGFDFKNGGFACARITGYKIKSTCAKLVKIKLGNG